MPRPPSRRRSSRQNPSWSFRAQRSVRSYSHRSPPRYGTLVAGILVAERATARLYALLWTGRYRISPRLSTGLRVWTLARDAGP